MALNAIFKQGLVFKNFNKMELCQCERYQKAVEKLGFFSLGTIHPILPRIPAPENSCIKWTCNKANYEDTRPTKPVLILNSYDIETGQQTEEQLESKWIPVQPGVISQKIVNESKTLQTPF